MLRTSACSLEAAWPGSNIPMRSRHTKVGSRVLAAAKHHWATRVRPWTSPGISLPVFSARYSTTAADSATELEGARFQGALVARTAAKLFG